MSTSAMNKPQILRRFYKTRDSYEQNAQVQTQMAGQLLTLLRQHAGREFTSVLEIGSGTGLLTRSLLMQCSIRHFWANDLALQSPALPQAAQGPVFTFLPGDIETIPNLPAGLALIISNAALQWIQDLPALLAKLHASLAPGSWLVFSSFGPKHFTELTSLGSPSLAYLSLAETSRLAGPWFQTIQQEESIHPCTFPDTQAMLRHLQATGVTGLTRRIWSRSHLRQFLETYQTRHATADGVTLTYHPTFHVLRKLPCP